MAESKRICPRCGRKMKQQFIGLYHEALNWDKRENNLVDDA